MIAAAFVALLAVVLAGMVAGVVRGGLPPWVGRAVGLAIGAASAVALASLAWTAEAPLADRMAWLAIVAGVFVGFVWIVVSDPPHP